MAKHTLILEDDFNFDLIGICSHHSDYRLCWGINNELGLNLVKAEESFMVSGRKGVVVSSHSWYVYYSEEENIEFHLIQNKDEKNLLIPERAQIDYFLVIIDAGVIDIENLLEKLKNTAEIIAAYDFDPYELKSANRFVF